MILDIDRVFSAEEIAMVHRHMKTEQPETEVRSAKSDLTTSSVLEKMPALIHND